MLKQEDILQDLKSLIPEDIIKVNEPLKRYTYRDRWKCRLLFISH